MAVLTANASGRVTGKFTIPAGLPAGIKSVDFSGGGGSHGSAVFTGQGTLLDEVWRQVTTSTTSFWAVNVDPLAQTFSLPANTQLAGVELWFTNAGASRIRVQIRETANGVPTRSVLGQGEIVSSSVVVGSATSIVFDRPIFLNGSTEYALVILTDDQTAAVSIAELGKWDNSASRWVASQPYEIGVLLSSSNASTWTPHQDRDLAFRLITMDYGVNGTTRTVSLGTVTVAGVTDLMLLPVAEAAAPDARMEYQLTLPDATVISVQNGVPVRLASAITGTVTVNAVLHGKGSVSAILLPGTKLVTGVVSTTGTYFTRAVPGGASSKVRIIYEAVVPVGSSVAIDVQDGAGGAFTNIPVTSQVTVNADTGFMEFTHVLGSFSPTTVRARVTLTGTTAARPRVKSLRVIVS